MDLIHFLRKQGKKVFMMMYKRVTLKLNKIQSYAFQSEGKQGEEQMIKTIEYITDCIKC